MVLQLVGRLSGDGEVCVYGSFPSVGLEFYIDIGGILCSGPAWFFGVIRIRYAVSAADKCGYDGQCNEVTFFHCSSNKIGSVQR